jgi:hypothetical protein
MVYVKCNEMELTNHPWINSDQDDLNWAKKLEQSRRYDFSIIWSCR